MRRSWTMTSVLGGLLALSATSGRGALSEVSPPLQAAAPPAASASAVEAHLVAGLAAYRRLRFSEAERHFRAAVDADPRSAAAHYYLGYAIYKIAEPRRPDDPGKQRAAGEFARAYEIDPVFRPDWGRRGR